MFNAPLRGVRIVEQGTFITGPCAGMMLADLGADVIKVESPEGDPYRAYQRGHYSPHFQAYNRNKRAISCDLKLPADRELFERLVAGADVYIQNFRPGTAERLGAGVKRLRGLNPRLVYCSISGFGADGPYAERPSYDSVAQALSGFLSVVVDPERPRFLGPALADAITGIYAAYGVLGALLERANTGQGRHVEVSMFEAMAHFAVEPFAAYFALGETPKSSDRPRLAQAYILRTADERLLAIHLSSLEKFWTGLTTAIEAPELREDPRFSERLLRIRNYEALGTELDLRFRRRPLADWVARLSAQRRAVRADQRHRRGRERSAGAPPRPGRSGRGGHRGRSRSGAPGAAVRRPPRDVGHRGPAPQPARRRDPGRPRKGRRLAGGRDTGRAPGHGMTPMTDAHATLFPTTLVGSMPQPDWLIDREKLAGRFPPRVRARELWRIPPEHLQEAQDDATIIAIRAQEEAGLDIVTDGEIRRESYSNLFANALDGVDLDNPGTALDRSGHPVPVPRVTGPIRRRHAVGVRDLEFLRRHTTRPVKVTVPGPFTMSQQAQIDHYGGSRHLASADYAAALNAEIRDLFSAGADVVQIDEPYMQARPEEARAVRARGAEPGARWRALARPRCTSASATPRSSMRDRRPTRSCRNSRAAIASRSRSKPRSRSSTARS